LAKTPREYHLLRMFGLTLAQYAKLLKKQKGKCGVCLRPAQSFVKNLAVDHDHKTGEIYGLLCTYCNQRFIGRDRDPALYTQAAKFLRKGTGYFVPDLARFKKKRRRKK